VELRKGPGQKGYQGVRGGEVADLAGHVDTRTTQVYRDPVRPSLPHAIGAWDQLLAKQRSPSGRSRIGDPSVVQFVHE
jgi:hypothetical protein